MLDLDSKPLNKQSNQLTLIKNAHSPVTFPSEEKFSKVWSSQPKCKEPLSSEEIIFTTSPNITDTKRDIETSMPISPPLSPLRKETSSLSANADLSAKPYLSTYLRSFLTKSLVTSENNSCSSELILCKIYFTTHRYNARKWVYFYIFRVKKDIKSKVVLKFIKKRIKWIFLIIIK